MRGKSALTFAAGIVALLAAVPGARAADNWPSRPIHIIVPYPSGGIVDIVARAVTEQVGRDTKQAIVVEGRAGANSNIGTAGGRAQRGRRLHLAGHGTRGAGQSRRSTRMPAGTR